MNKQLGYTSPADLIDLYPKFYWSGVSADIQSSIRYLNVTSNGRRWIANLDSNIFRAERELNLCGPERRDRGLRGVSNGANAGTS